MMRQATDAQGKGDQTRIAIRHSFLLASLPTYIGYFGYFGDHLPSPIPLLPSFPRTAQLFTLSSCSIKHTRLPPPHPGPLPLTLIALEQGRGSRRERRSHPVQPNPTSASILPYLPSYLPSDLHTRTHRGEERFQKRRLRTREALWRFATTTSLCVEPCCAVNRRGASCPSA